MLPIVAFAVIAIAAIALLVSTIWFYYEAFKVHVGWGFACLFVPFAALVFLFMHWREALKPFVASLLATLMLGGGISVALSQSGIDWQEFLPENLSAMVPIGEKERRTLRDELKNMQTEEHAAETPPVEATVETTEEADAAATPPIKAGSEAAAVQAEIDRLQAQLVAQYESLKAQKAALDEQDPQAVRTFNEAVRAYEADLKQKQQLEQQLKALE